MAEPMKDGAWLNPHLLPLCQERLGLLEMGALQFKADNAVLKERLTAALQENARLKAEIETLKAVQQKPTEAPAKPKRGPHAVERPAMSTTLPQQQAAG